MIHAFTILYPKTDSTVLPYARNLSLLRVCRKVYEESQHLLHDQPVTLTLPLSPGPHAPLFRNYKTTYDPLEGILTAAEIRKMTNIKLDIVTYGPGDRHDEPFSDEVRRRLQYALRVLKGNKVLERVCIRLSVLCLWTDLLSHTTTPMPFDMNDVTSVLEPFLCLGGVRTRIRVENIFGLQDCVVDRLRAARRMHVGTLVKGVISEWNKLSPGEARDIQDPFGQGLPEESDSYLVLERKALIRREIRKLLEGPPRSIASTPRYLKCGECLIVFETEAQLRAHRIFSNHFAKHVLHELPNYVTGYDMFCRGYHQKNYHFKQTKDSALKCGTCLAKFTHWEGLQVHVTAFDHSFYDPGGSYEDIERLFDSPHLLTQEPLFECEDCYTAFESTRYLRLQELESTLPVDGPVEEKPSAPIEPADKSPEDSDDANQSQEALHNEDGPNISNETPHKCLQCGEFFEAESDLIIHIKEMNASRYAEPGHFVDVHHPSIPAGRPGRLSVFLPTALVLSPHSQSSRTTSRSTRVTGGRDELGGRWSPSCSRRNL